MSTLSAERRSTVEVASWIAAVIGLWVLVSPFVLESPPSGSTAFLSNVVAGILVLALAAYSAYRVRTVRRRL